MKIYLDDKRVTPDGWERVYTVPHLKEVYTSNRNTVTHISLDNDLGSHTPEGYTFMDWLEEEMYHNPHLPLPEITVHSSNSPRKAYMEQAYKTILRRKLENSQSTDPHE
jgi:hypothetical protein